MSITASALRKNIYQLLDRVLETNKPLEVDRKGQRLLILSKKKKDKMALLRKRDIINGDPEEIVHNDWSKEWKP